MSEVSNNYVVQRPVVSVQTQNLQPRYATRSRSQLQDYFEKEKRKNSGLIEKFYNWVKNTTGIGTGSKKVQQKIELANNGQISQQEALESIRKYNNSQENSAQILGDATSIAVGGLTFLKLNRLLKMGQGAVKLNEKNTEGLNRLFDGMGEKAIKNLIESVKSNKKMTAILLGISSLTAGITKYWTLKINRIGSNEFKVNDNDFVQYQNAPKELQKAIKKQTKKDLNNERHKANFRNFISGSVNALMLPALSLGGIVAAPLLAVGNSLNRYFIGNHTDKNKSLGNYASDLANNGVVNTLAATAIAVPAFKKGEAVKMFDKNFKSALEKLQNAKFKDLEFKNKSTYDELDEILMGSKDIKDIVYNPSISINEQINKLTKENIFAVKFKQIANDGTALSKALKDECPPSRTLEQAQLYIEKTYGTNYKLSKLLGVGTVAETYLAKDSSGKEVCVKIIKDGITKEKILQDKEKFVKIVKNLKDKSQDEIDYLVKNVNDLSDGIVKEVDLQNEMNAAQKLMQFTQKADVVKPIDVKNNIYVMEKAKGISLSSFVELNEAKAYLDVLKKDSTLGEIFVSPKYKSKLSEALKGAKTKEERIRVVENFIKKVEDRTPEYGDISISKEDSKYLIEQYQKVLVEQFNKVEKNGKAIHADIHPGNIFIDVNALRSRKGNVFTLIDTGNVVEQSLEQSLNSINLTSYIKHANYKDITEYVMAGAKLPEGMTMEQAKKIVEEELKKCFFDPETRLETVNNNSIITLTSNIMKKHKIIPSDTQLNLNKAMKSADNSLSNLGETLSNLVFKDSSLLGGIGEIAKDAVVMNKKYKALIAMQEKQNLKQLTLEQQLKQKHNPNNLDENSEDYLIYKLKQLVMGESKIPKDIVE